MTDKLKVDRKVSDRTDAERDRARPVDLPAGSYDAAKLRKSLDEAAQAKNDDNRDEMVAKAVEKHRDTPFTPGTIGLNPGEKRVKVEDERLGITEERVVFDKDAREEAETAQEEAVEPKQPGAETTATESKGSK